MAEMFAVLEDLVASGDWPQVTVSLDWPVLILEADYGIRLYGPPWWTVEQRVSRGEGPFWNMLCAAPEGLVRDKALVVGDMGIGSESPIVLDFRNGQRDPRVLVLTHAPDGVSCRWLPLADSLESLLRAIRRYNPSWTA